MSALRFLEDRRARGRELPEGLRQRPEPAALKAFVAQASGEIAAREAAETPAAPPSRPPRVGDTVEVLGRGIRGELVELTAERARLQRGGLRFEVPAAQVRLVEAAAARDGGAGRERVAVAVVRPAEEETPGELNLVGRRAREALDALASFLDRAVRAGLPQVRIVHGVGTGALRRAVHDFLATSPYCAGHRDAEPEAGGTGVTLVELG